MSPTLVKVFLGLAAVLSAFSAVSAESHTVAFDNQCGKGTPTLILNGQTVSTGQPYTQDSAISGGIAYLQTGECGFNGENCTLMEMTLGNPTCAGCGSSTDISLIPPHAFNVQTSFSYYNGCNGQGTACSSGSCSQAFHVFNDNQVQVQCESNDVNLVITFCGDASTNELVVGGSGSGAANTSASHVSSAAASSSAASSATVVSVPTQPASKATQTLIAVSSSSAAPSASPSVNRGTCKNKKRMERRRTPGKLARAHEQLSH